MKKKIIAGILCAALGATMLAGCRESKEENNKDVVQ